MNRLEYRMYGLVPYNLSPIQQGIQFGHAVQEFNNKMHGFYSSYEDDLFIQFKDWAVRDKTFIILNGGTTNDNDARIGTLNQHLVTLNQMGVKTAEFYEPDLGDQLTAVVFLLDERVWDERKYPSPKFDITTGQYELDIHEFVDNMGGNGIWELRQFIKQFRLA